MSAYDRVMEERRKLVEKIIENMKQGYVMPQAKWDRSVYISNPVSHARYRGINFARLYLAMADQGYTDGRWMTYKQAESMGWKIRRGEHGIHLEKYIFEKTVEEKNPNTGEMEKITKRLDRPMVNQFVVFNASQIDGIPQPEDIKPMEHDEVLQIAEDVIASSECPIKETMEGRAYYSPGLDEIHLNAVSNPGQSDDLSCDHAARNGTQYRTQLPFEPGSFRVFRWRILCKGRTACRTRSFLFGERSGNTTGGTAF